jgi:hypothetical protein
VLAWRLWSSLLSRTCLFWSTVRMRSEPTMRRPVRSHVCVRARVQRVSRGEKLDREAVATLLEQTKRGYPDFAQERERFNQARDHLAQHVLDMRAQLENAAQTRKSKRDAVVGLEEEISTAQLRLVSESERVRASAPE